MKLTGSVEQEDHFPDPVVSRSAEDDFRQSTIPNLHATQRCYEREHGHSKTQPKPACGGSRRRAPYRLRRYAWAVSLPRISIARMGRLAPEGQRGAILRGPYPRPSDGALRGADKRSHLRSCSGGWSRGNCPMPFSHLATRHKQRQDHHTVRARRRDS